MSVDGSAGGWVAVGFLILIGLVAIFGNLLLIALVLSKPDMRENLNCFVLSLAAVDLLTALLIMPLQSYHSAVEVAPDSALCMCINFFAILSALASVLSLLCVTADRYLVISRPLRYVTLATVERVLCVIASMWLYSVGGSLVILLPDDAAAYPPGTNSSEAGCNIASLVGVPYGFFLMCNFLIPIPVMLIMYAHIFVIARRHAKAIHNARRVSCVADDALAQPSLTKQNIRIAAVLFFITAYFLFSWTATVVLLALIRYLPGYTFELTVAYKIVFYTNAAINPFLYMFHHRKLRTYLVAAWRRRLPRVAPGANAAPSPPATETLDMPRVRVNSLFLANHHPLNCAFLNPKKP